MINWINYRECWLHILYLLNMVLITSGVSNKVSRNYLQIASYFLFAKIILVKVYWSPWRKLLISVCLKKKSLSCTLVPNEESFKWLLHVIWWQVCTFPSFFNLGGKMLQMMTREQSPIILKKVNKIVFLALEFRCFQSKIINHLKSITLAFVKRENL